MTLPRTKIKHAPATPLPWANQPGDDSSHGVLSNWRGEPFEVAANAAPTDAAYIAHAANAYPRLVEALREASVSINSKVVGYERERMNRWISLLRELGEV